MLFNIFSHVITKLYMMSIWQIVLSLSFIIYTYSQILAIDFGTEFIKAAVVNKGSGKAFSIV